MVASIMLMTKTTKAAPCSAQERPGCQAAEQRLQNSLSQVGQATGTPCNSKIFSQTLKTFDYLRLGASADVTNSVAPSGGAPCAGRVHRDLRVQPDHDDHGEDADHDHKVCVSSGCT